MILSSDADVSWRLNDLLVAGQKARYLAIKVSGPSGAASAEPVAEFTLWAPRVVQLIERQQPLLAAAGEPVAEQKAEGNDEAAERKSR